MVSLRGVLCLTFCLAMFVYSGVVSVEAAVVDVKVRSGAVLEDVIPQLSKQTGYTFRVDSDLLKSKIVGVFREVKLESFFKRALKEHDVAVVLDDEKKEAWVYYAGNSSLLATVNKKAGIANSGKTLSEEQFLAEREREDVNVVSGSKHEEGGAGIDSLTGLTWEEAEKQMGLLSPGNQRLDGTKGKKGLGEEQFLAEREGEDVNIASGSKHEEGEAGVDPLTGLTWEEAEKQMGL